LIQSGLDKYGSGSKTDSQPHDSPILQVNQSLIDAVLDQTRRIGGR
jgi:hypothetical protein